MKIKTCDELKKRHQKEKSKTTTKVKSKSKKNENYVFCRFLKNLLDVNGVCIAYIADAAGLVWSGAVVPMMCLYMLMPLYLLYLSLWNFLFIFSFTFIFLMRYYRSRS